MVKLQPVKLRATPEKIKLQVPANSKKDKETKPGSRPRKQVDAYLKYSGMAIQMGIVILIGTFAGQKLDAYFQSERPYLTVLLALLSIFAALYLSLKDILFQNDKDQ
ncbi:MAG: AtpZ/AtpI family protein [Phaeodactylibacter sp.]|nr:AtpZ/AtpI family protein [Phaeodactylibacter sp.]